MRPEDLGIGQLFALVPDAVIVADVAADAIVLWNPGAEAMFGWKAEEVVGGSVGVIIPASHQASHHAGSTRYALTGDGGIIGGGKPVLMPARHRDGHELMIELTLAPLQLAEPHRFVLAIARDVTDRLAADAALRDATRHKDEFLSVISHELRTPLNFITGFGSILQDELDGPLSERQHAHLAVMLAGADRMLELVDDLLDAAKIQAGRLLLDVQDVAVDALLAEVADMMAPLADRQAVALRCEAPAPLVARADPRRLEQVVSHLVRNALKFTAAGGQIGLRACAADGRIRVEVADTGCGIAPEHLARVFEPFRQLDMSDSRRAGGAGLGLTISRSMIEQMGGTLGVDSVPGQGSTFWFELPGGGALLSGSPLPGTPPAPPAG